MGARSHCSMFKCTHVNHFVVSPTSWSLTPHADDIEFRLSFLPIYQLFPRTDSGQEEVYTR